MFCPGCGEAHHETDRFCKHCGTLLPGRPDSDPEAVTAPQQVPPVGSQPVAYAPAPSPPQPQPIYYARLIALLLVVVVCSSASLFCFILANKMQVGGKVLLAAGQLAGAAFVTLWFATRKWKQINSHPERKGMRNLVVATACVEIVFLGVAAGMGAQLGAKRAAYNALIRNWTHLEEVGQRISDKRNSVASDIPAYLEMYRLITPDVKDLQTTAVMLLEQEQRYQTDYPEYGPNATKEIAHLRVTQQRASLLELQIQIAAKMSLQDEQTRALTWTSEMIPLLEREDALDHNN